ncbi:TIGR04255 family protein [Streptomyces sp. NPDC058459]|uniref:TIGR04255 family protein n=1 Tax=Streptomyces sp. NPDC058459 TaxID=3346508 RepID=UPI0036658D07
MGGGSVLKLPEHSGERLSRSPLILVAIQITFEDLGDIARADARAVQNVMGRTSWPGLFSNPILSGVLSATGINQQPTRQGWRITSPDAFSAASIAPDSATIETRAYPGWGTYSGHFSLLVGALAEVLDPQQHLRLGLRYINQVALPDWATDWKEFIPPTLLGPLLDETLGPGITATEQRIVIDVDEGAHCLLRHGAFADSDGKSQYLLDYDVFGESQPAFEPRKIMEEAERLHNVVRGLFRATITDKLYQHLR